MTRKSPGVAGVAVGAPPVVSRGQRRFRKPPPRRALREVSDRRPELVKQTGRARIGAEGIVLLSGCAASGVQCPRAEVSAAFAHERRCRYRNQSGGVPGSESALRRSNSLSPQLIRRQEGRVLRDVAPRAVRGIRPRGLRSPVRCAQAGSRPSAGGGTSRAGQKPATRPKSWPAQPGRQPKTPLAGKRSTESRKAAWRRIAAAAKQPWAQRFSLPATSGILTMKKFV